jgi:hypothetical protein
VRGALRSWPGRSADIAASAAALTLTMPLVPPPLPRCLRVRGALRSWPGRTAGIAAPVKALPMTDAGVTSHSFSCTGAHLRVRGALQTCPGRSADIAAESLAALPTTDADWCHLPFLVVYRGTCACVGRRLASSLRSRPPPASQPTATATASSSGGVPFYVLLSLSVLTAYRYVTSCRYAPVRKTAYRLTLPLARFRRPALRGIC